MQEFFRKTLHSWRNLEGIVVNLPTSYLLFEYRGQNIVIKVSNSIILLQYKQIKKSEAKTIWL